MRIIALPANWEKAASYTIASHIVNIKEHNIEGQGRKQNGEYLAAEFGRPTYT